MNCGSGFDYHSFPHRCFRSWLLPDGDLVSLHVLPTFRLGGQGRPFLRPVCRCWRVFRGHRFALSALVSPVIFRVADIRRVAYGVFQINSSMLKNWQCLFIIEGLLTCVMAIVGWIFLPSRPGAAWFLSREERMFADERIDHDIDEYSSRAASRKIRPRLSKRDVVETIRDWKLWFVLVFNICASVPSTAFSVFLPLVVRGMGFSSLSANLVSGTFLLPRPRPPEESGIVKLNRVSSDVCAAVCVRCRGAGCLRLEL